MARDLIGYLRVAPRERSDERPSIDAQRAAIAAAASDRGWTVSRYEQDVRSGRSMRRPGLHNALESCLAGDAAGVVVARLDRLTYSVADLAQLVSRAVDGRFAIVSLDPTWDLADERGASVGAILTEAARWQPPAIAKPARALGGRRPGRPSSTPAGVAERIRDLRGQGMTLQAICDTLNAEGVPTPRGGSEWRPTSLRSVLRAEPVGELSPIDGPGRPPQGR